MNIKKLTAIIVTIIMLIPLAACGKKADGVIPLYKLEFGMTREQVNALMDAEPDTEGDGYDMYLYIPSDLDERLNSCIFNYNGASRLYGLYIETDYCKESEAESVRKDIMEKLNSLYGFSADGWEFGEAKNSYSYIDADRKLGIMTRVNNDEEGYSASVTILSDIHSEDENADNIPVIPKN